MEETIEAKQEFLRDNILDKGFDANAFADFLISKKGEDGGDISNWSMSDLQQVVKEFTDIQTNNFYPQNTPIQITPEIPKQEPKNIPEQNLEKEIQKENNNPEPEKLIESTPNNNTNNNTNNNLNNNNLNNNNNVNNNNTNNNDNKQKPKPKLENQKSLNCEVYGIIGSEFVASKQIDPTPLCKFNNLIITIGFPEKVEGSFFSKAYVNYLILTEPINLKVRRRYSDFDWLHQIIFNLFPNCVIPPIPPKKHGGEKFVDVFINKRMSRLQNFMNYLVANPLIKNCQIVYDFLSIENDAEFNKKKNEYQKLKPPSNLNDYTSMNYKLMTLVDKEKETYFDNIKDNENINENLLNKLNESLKQLSTQMDNIILKIEEVSKIWNDLYKNSEKYYDEKPIINSYLNYNQLFTKWAESIKKQKKLINSNTKEYFKYVKNHFKSMKDLFYNVENNKSNYYKNERNLISKKEDLFKKGDVTKWELDPNDKTNVKNLTQDKYTAYFKMCAKETANVIQLRQYYGYFLNRVIEEYERIRKLNSNNHKKTQISFCKSLTDILSEFDKNVVEILTSLVVEDNRERKMANNNEGNNNGEGNQPNAGN